MCVCSAEGNEFENWLYTRVASLYDVEYSDEQIIEYINKQVGCKDNAISGDILRSKYTVGRDAYLLAYIALDDNSLNTLLKTNAFDWNYNDVTDSIVDSIERFFVGHKQPERAQAALRGQQSGQAEHLLGGAWTIQFPHRQTHQQDVYKRQVFLPRKREHIFHQRFQQ